MMAAIAVPIPTRPAVAMRRTMTDSARARGGVDGRKPGAPSPASAVMRRGSSASNPGSSGMVTAVPPCGRRTRGSRLDREDPVEPGDRQGGRQVLAGRPEADLQAVLGCPYGGFDEYAEAGRVDELEVAQVDDDVSQIGRAH